MFLNFDEDSQPVEQTFEVNNDRKRRDFTDKNYTSLFHGQ